MKRLLLTAAALLMALAATAQAEAPALQRGLKGEYDVGQFPTVMFTWNSPNPEWIEASRFTLTEDGKPVEFTVRTDDIVRQDGVTKNVLILWEDMASHSRQTRFTRELLMRFLNEEHADPADRFGVAVFNRQHDSRPSVLSPLGAGLTADLRSLRDAVQAYRASGERYATFPDQSDLYLAINEGIDMLKKAPSNRTGVIVVVTAGLNMKASGASTEMETVRKNALDAGIPIYVVKYPLTGNAPEVNSLATSTYGTVVSTVDVSEAEAQLVTAYRRMNNRLKGNDYHITFTSNGKNDGKVHNLQLAVDKVRQPLPPYTAPGATFLSWVEDHLLWVIIVAVVVVGGVVAIVLVARSNRKRRAAAEQAARDQMLQQQQESERRSREAIDSMRRQQEAKEQAAREEGERKAREEEYERLARLMQTKNLRPRLQCKAGTEGFSYTIGKPLVTIGREADNDVAFTMRNDRFNNQTVSGHHAEIHFNGAAFEVVNVSRSYKQGIIVNGQFHQRYTLRGGDMIGLGEAVLTFYL